jgi:N-acyl-L-homoserine lactone synthetase
MIVVVEKYNAHKYSHLIEKMYRLRAHVFHDRLGWDVQVVDGKERDKYDDGEPVYVIHTDDKAREVKGSLRLLPTTGPTLLAECFADPGLLDGLFFASAEMIAGLGDVAVSAGIESIVGNFDASVFRLYRRIGLQVEILGRTSRYGRPVYLGLFPISELLLRRVKQRLANARPAFARMERMAA